MMKYILNLLMFYSLAAYSQYEGKYCLYSTWTNRCVTIQSNNRFSYNYVDCTRQMTGIGRYKLSRTELVLHFEEDTLQKYIDTGKADVKTLKPIDKDFCKIEMILSDKEDSPIIGGTIVEMGTNNGIVTDLHGRGTLKIPRNHANIVVQISYLGMYTIRIPVSPEMDYRLNVIGNLDKQTAIQSGQIYTFRIKHKTRKSFDLVRDRRFEKYDKIPAPILM